MIVLSVLLFTGCGEGVLTAGSPIVITERHFVTQIQEIVLNVPQHVGRDIQIEGMFWSIDYQGEDFHVVYRYAQACCEDHLDMIGFGLILPIGMGAVPNGTWISVNGTLDFDPDYEEFLIIVATSVETMETPGAEIV